VKDDVKDRYVFMDQGRELYRSKAIRDLFEKEFGYEIRVTGTGAHHQNGLVERANQTMDKAIRAMLIGAGLPVNVGQSDPSIPVPQELHSRERSSAPRTDSATSTSTLVE